MRWNDRIVSLRKRAIIRLFRRGLSKKEVAVELAISATQLDSFMWHEKIIIEDVIRGDITTQSPWGHTANEQRRINHARASIGARAQLEANNNSSNKKKLKASVKDM